MKKRVACIILILCSLAGFTSCFHEFGEFPERTNLDISLPLPPKYTENYTYLPIIEYKGTEFCLDQMSVRERGYEVNELSLSFEEIESKIRGMDNAMIVVATVLENPKQLTEASATNISFSAEVVCPVKIDDILYQSEGNTSSVGDIIEVDLSGEMCIIEGWMEYLGEEETTVSGEFVAEECELYLSHSNGLAMISGAQYLLYLYDTEQPEYDDYRRYDVFNRFEITNYCNNFEHDSKARLLFQNDDWGVPFRFYDIQKEGGFVYVPSVYPESPGLASENDIKTVGIKIGDTIVEGYEQSENGYKCIGYSEKDGKYSYEFVEYEVYDLSSGIIPDGCPIIVCELNETIELLSTQYSTLHLNQGGDFFYAELFDMNGDGVASYSPTHNQIYSGNKEHQKAGMYWFKVVFQLKDPSMASWDGTPEVGKEYVAQKSYLFIIIMD